MKHLTPILSISGSDSTGLSGIQADIKTIAALGGYAVTAVTCISLQAAEGERVFHDIAPDVIVGQVASIVNDVHPRAIKIGLIRHVDAIRRLRNEVIGCRQLVLAPGITDSDGTLMMEDEAVDALTRCLLPEATLLMLRCRDAERVLGHAIATDDDMIAAARQLHQMGAKWVLLRGGLLTQGRLTALMYGEGKQQFFSSYNTEGWQRHGVGGALSAAITTRLALGDDVPEAIRHAHDFIHSQVVYATEGDDRNLRPVDLYNQFVSLVAGHYREAHDVAYYADRLCITPRYLSAVTDRVVGKSPKQIIAGYIIGEARNHLDHTRSSIQEIAFTLGFSSQAMFCRFFKAHVGKTPSQYRG